MSRSDGEVGPSLDGLGDRRTIAGRLANTPENLARWIGSPQQVDPGNLMPDLGLGPAEAAATSPPTSTATERSGR